MRTKQARWMLRGSVLLLAILLGGCSDTDDNRGAGKRTFRICPGPEAQTEILKALFEAHPGDTVQLCPGTYAMTTGLILSGKNGITIRGAGQDQTILDFAESDSSEGIHVNGVEGITIEGLHVIDTPGNGIRIFRSKYVTLRDVAAGWSDSDPVTPGYQPSTSNGAYALYPVESQQILMEDCYAYGSSDAGVYVGQSSDIVVRRCLAKYNVAGYEFENTYRAVFEDNEATENTGGFLVFDLPDLSQYGEANIVRRNRAWNNNTPNFAPIGNIVGLVPRGTGMLVLATDRLEIYDNVIEDHDTLGIAIVNFGLADKNYPDRKYDFFPEGIDIHSNVFRNNGTNPQEPNPDRGAGSFLPLILQLKNKGQSAHIIWDGGVDQPNGCTQPPTDKYGVPLTEANPAEPPEARYEARVNILGRPNVQRSDNPPDCGSEGSRVQERKYNAWKWKDGQMQADLRLCITNNSFDSSAPAFLNAKFPTSAEEDIPRHLLTPASNDLTPHACRLEHPVSLRPLQLPYRVSSGGQRPSRGEIRRACDGVPDASGINGKALNYNCPRLDQYALFRNAADPTRDPNGSGVPFDLNSALFSDYAVKHRFLFVPPGESMRLADSSNPESPMVLPIGTVIAKTFAFRKDSAAGTVEDVVETRLLIKRKTDSGATWVGLPYIWKTAPDGSRYAELHVEGGSASVSYDYVDPDTGQRLAGAVPQYAIPAALNCVTCHGGTEREKIVDDKGIERDVTGANPLGLKPRYLRASSRAALAPLVLPEQRQAFLTAPRHPRWNVPGDSGRTPHSKLDIQERVRAYLEVNCLHCHSPGGAGSNSGLFLDALRNVNVRYGICKKPVAAGRGSGGRLYDIVPGKAGSASPGQSEGSILYYRMASAESGVRMPPLARSVVHGEAVNLIATWINTVLPVSSSEAGPGNGHQVTRDGESCSGPFAGLPVHP